MNRRSPSPRRVGRFVFVACPPDKRPWEAIEILQRIGERLYVRPARARPEEEIACPS